MNAGACGIISFMGALLLMVLIIISNNLSSQIAVPAQIGTCSDGAWGLGTDCFWGREQDAVAREGRVRGLVLLDRSVEC